MIEFVDQIGYIGCFVGGLFTLAIYNFFREDLVYNSIKNMVDFERIPIERIRAEEHRAQNEERRARDEERRDQRTKALLEKELRLQTMRQNPGSWESRALQAEEKLQYADQLLEQSKQATEYERMTKAVGLLTRENFRKEEFFKKEIASLHAEIKILKNAIVDKKEIELLHAEIMILKKITFDITKKT